MVSYLSCPVSMSTEDCSNKSFTLTSPSINQTSASTELAPEASAVYKGNDCSSIFEKRISLICHDLSGKWNNNHCDCEASWAPRLRSPVYPFSVRDYPTKLDRRACCKSAVQCLARVVAEKGCSIEDKE